MQGKKLPKIIHIIGQLGLGGAERQLFLLIRGLVNRYDFTVITYNSNLLEYAEVLKKLNVDIIILKKDRGLLGNLKLLIALVVLIKRYTPDIVQTWLVSGNFWGRLAVILSGRKIHTIASVRTVVPKLSYFEIISEKLLAIRTNCIITNSMVGKIAMIGYGLPENKIHAIYNGINPEIFNISINKQEIQKEISIPVDRFVIGTVGRMDTSKNQIMLINAAKILTQREKSMHFVIVGQGRLRSYLEKKILENRLENVFTLMDQRTDIERVFRAFDVFVLTSLWEGLPNVVMEAMSAKIPVIATNVGGVSELIENKVNGLLIEKNDQMGLVNGIHCLYQDQFLRQTFTQAAFDTINNRYSLYHMIEMTNRIYEKILMKS